MLATLIEKVGATKDAITGGNMFGVIRRQTRWPLRLALLGTVGFPVLGAGNLSYAQTNSDPLPSQPKNSGNRIEQIVVTSQRRSTVIRKVPVSVTALSGATLARRHLQNIQDIATITPNVSFATTYAEPHVFVRGAGENLTDLGAETAVPIHLDDVYLARPQFGFSDLLDVQRVEVLRGPQGTLFGHNATGGVVNVIPNLPTPDFDAGASVTVGGGPTIFGTQDFVNGRLNADGTLFGRLSVQDNYNEGYFKNIAQSGPRNLNDENAQGLRGQLEWRPSDVFSTRLSVDFDHGRDAGQAIAFAGMPVPSPNGEVLPATLLGGVTADPKKYEAEANQGADRNQFTDIALHSTLQVGWGTVQLINSVTQTRSHLDVDQDLTNLDLADLAYEDHAYQTFNEVLYQSPQDRRWRFQIGGVEFYEDATEAVEAHALYLRPPFSPVNLNPILLGGRVYTQSYAGFGHTEFDVLPVFHVFGGFRYTLDEKTDQEYNNFIGTLRQGKDWRDPNFTVGARYDVTDHVNLYATYSTGYKGGGFNTGSLTPAFNPETDRTWEIGAKSSLLHDRLGVNVSAFTNNYSGLQVNQISTFSSLVSNAGAARIRGVEFEGTARPIPDLRLDLTASYLDARFTSYSTIDASRPTLGTLNLAGNFLPNAPPYTLSAGAYYTFHVNDIQTVEVGGRIYGQGRTYFTPFNVGATGQVAVFRGDLNALYTVNSHWTVNAFARNVTNALVRSYGQALANVVSGAYEVNYDPGRTVGVTAAWRY